MLLLACVACGDDEPAGSGGAAASSSSSGAGLGGHCADDVAAVACANDCAFDPADIDCAPACSHLAAVCAEAACGLDCDPLASDMTVCLASCDAAKTEHCGNLAWGCYAQGDNCDAVGRCFADNEERGLSP